MPSEKEPFYDPVPPTYDEALASSSRHHAAWLDENVDQNDAEAQGLLAGASQGAPGSSSRPPRGYRAPTVETDDEGSGWDSDSDVETAQVRREMQEMDIEEPQSSRSTWGKRIGFSLSLPQWKWSWRPRIPTLPRFRIQLPSTEPTRESARGDADEQPSEESSATPIRTLQIPKIDGVVAIVFIARAVAIFVVLGFVYMLFVSDIFGGISNHMNSGFRFNPEDLRVHVQNSVDPLRMRAAVKHFSSYAHIAGTEGDFATAKDVESMFHKAGLDSVSVEEFFVYINYPRKDGRAVQIMDDKGEKATWTAKLEEDERHGETAGHQTYAFHGHSKSGDVKGKLLYANFGSREDFKALKDKGIETKGAIALVRYFGTQEDRALKVKAAELAGFAGCLIYSDPQQDGFLKGEVAPGGQYMPQDGVQRGSVSLMSWVVGDVLTPGWASLKEVPRMKIEGNKGLVGIPSLPLAWRDAQVLLQHLKGHGQKVPKDWEGGVPDVEEWWTGGDASPIVRLKNEQDENDRQPIWNVYGRIDGMEESAKSLIIGNHRDSWAFGATDPHSGTAVMIELARIFGDLLSRGWRPLRTIEFMSWDAEEYNLIGSTEFVEKNIDSLRQNAYAYINLDTVVAGREFHASGSPVFEKTLMHALGRVADPALNTTLKDLWTERKAHLEGLGAGSDYVAFQDIAGTSSLDLGFTGATFPYHSSYDTFDLVEKVIDPDFAYHGLMAQVVGLLILDIADRSIVPFDMHAYGVNLQKWTEDLEKWAKKTMKRDVTRGDDKHKEDNQKQQDKDAKAQINFRELRNSAEMVTAAAKRFAKWEHEWDIVIRNSGGWESSDVGAMRMMYNNKMHEFETALLDLSTDGGIPNRTQFKHVVFGPQLWSGYDEAFFPAIRDLIEAGQYHDALIQLAKTSEILRRAARVLEL